MSELKKCFDTTFDEHKCKNDREKPCPKYDACLFLAKYQREIGRLHTLPNNELERQLEKYANYFVEQNKLDQWIDSKEIADHFGEPDWKVYEKLKIAVRNKWFHLKKKPHEKFFLMVDFTKTPFHKQTQKILEKLKEEGL